MNISVISDLTWGGAATSCRRLVDGVRGTPGVEVRWLAARGNATSGADLCSDMPDLPSLLVSRLVARVCGGGLATSRQKWHHARSAAAALRWMKPDAVNLHNIHEAIPFSLLRDLPEVPVVVTLHDMWYLTGYCCYSFGCGKYTEGCTGDCPQLGKWGPALPGPATGWHERERFFRESGSRFAFVAPSKWLAEMASRRFDGKIRVETIPYGLDLDVFRPAECKKAVRTSLGLPPDRPVVLTGAVGLDDERKGAAILREACDLLRGRPLARRPVVVGFGSVGGNAELSDWIFTGSIKDERLLNLYYNAADVFVLPSLADNLPNTLIEAISSGAPCVSFDIGGCPDIVRNGMTGRLARYRDVADLAACIESILDSAPSARQEMSVACRRVAEQEYGLKLQASRYVALFKEMVTSR